MIIKQKLGNVNELSVGDQSIDTLLIEWYEANKRIIHSKTTSGRPVTLRFLQENPNLQQGDILWMEEDFVIVVTIKTCEAIVIQPKSILEASFICYEIGNKHLPLFYEGEELLIPYDASIHRLLEASGYRMKVEQRKLATAVKTSVAPHAHSGSTSLFNKILQLTTSS